MPKMTLPALLGNSPSFESKVPITKPTVPASLDLMEDLRQILDSGMITSATTVRRLEQAVAEYVGVKHAIAVSSCTSGLMLVLKALQLEGEVILPSFSFSATGHVILWNGLYPKFVDISRESFNVEVRNVEDAISERTKAILAVHIFGNPCDVEGLEKLAENYQLRLIFDAAHGLGSLFNDRKVGTAGHAEVFSLSPTKLVIAGEGGLVTTNDDELARLVRIGRDYGNPGNYDCEFPGLSARLPEFNALLAFRSFEQLEAHVAKRNGLAGIYRSLLHDVPGVFFQEIGPNCRATYKDFALLIDPVRFGMTRDHLAVALELENIVTRKYFHPPIHRQRAYRQYQWEYQGQLPVTEEVASSILCLPMFSHMQKEVVEQICEAICRIQRYSADVVAALNRRENQHGA